MSEGKTRHWNLRRVGGSLLTLLLATGTLPILAAPAQAPRVPRDPQEMEDVRETLQVLMVVSMKRALELSRDQEKVVVPKVQQVFEERERYTRLRRGALRDLQQKLGEESLPEREYRQVVSHLDDLERSHRELELRLRAEIDRSLNARQQAQMRVFVPRFRRQLQMHIEEVRRLHPPRGVAAPRPAPPSPEDDPDSGDEEF